MRSQHVRPALARLAGGRRRPGAGRRLPPAAPQRAILSERPRSSS
jgi:hypothetical protein